MCGMDQARCTAPKREVRMSGSVCVYAMRSRSSSVLEHTIRPLADDTTTPPVLHRHTHTVVNRQHMPHSLHAADRQPTASSGPWPAKHGSRKKGGI